MCVLRHQVTATLSKLTVLDALVSWDVTASPASIDPLAPRVTPDPATGVQVTPSVDVEAVNVPPERDARTNAGTGPGNAGLHDRIGTG